MIEILQETKTSVVCVKPVGIAAQGMDAQALPQLLAAQLGCEVYPVHRLDQAVGGVMVYAKTAKEAARLTQSMGEGGMQKTYLAVLTGCPEKTSGTLEDLLFHDRVKNKTYVVRRPRGGVKKAVLSYEILAEAEGLSLARVRLQTGRTHQIRVHMQYTRHPIVGDPVYNAHGPRDARAQLGLRRQFLHSYSIAFEHPTTGEPMAFADNLPQDLQEALDALAERSLGKTDAGREVAELMAASPVPSVEGEVPDE